ncbi:MAG: pyridoxamine 5'-phosphate oxidase family protein [Eubacteriales bacterium]|nr:pyridoxamine 5'-phosphate oxidase family protein [Eubacteriales bacterium]
MRRKDREVTDPGRIKEIILSADCCRLGFCDEGSAYIVPLNFGYEERNGKHVFYFHGAREGRKIDLMRNNPKVGFEIDIGHTFITGDMACSYSMNYQSVMGTGNIAFLEDTEEKRYALSLIMEHYTGEKEWNFPDQMTKAVCVWKMEVETISCKEHR